MKFREFPFSLQLQQAIDEIGFVDCTPVQEQSFIAYFEGKDIYAQSQTGTGKTAAFMLCALQELIRRNAAQSGASDVPGPKENSGLSPQERAEENESAAKDVAMGNEVPSVFAEGIKILVLAPTRELAQQIEQEAKLLSRFLPLQVAAFYGGVGYEEQHSHLKSGVQIITGTPGRIIDLAKSGELRLERVYIAVLDEADRMLDMGFVDDVRWIMNRLPPAAERLNMLFSATLNARVGNLTWEFMREGQIAEIVVESEQITTENVEQELYHVANREKLRLLLSLIEKYKPESAIIFCNTKGGASFLEGRLRDSRYQVRALIGDLPQARRTQIVGELKARKLRFLVATDVASRGLHIEGLPMVINYDLPDEAENYVHRIGRTARAGAVGRAVSLACERYVYNLADIERYIDSKIPVLWLAEENLIPYPKRGQGKRDAKGSRMPHRKPKKPGTPRENQRREANNSGRQEAGRNRSERALPKSLSRRLPKSLLKSLPKDKESRLRYYEKKYGENFGKADPEEAPKPQRADRQKGSQKPSQRSRHRANQKSSQMSKRRGKGQGSESQDMQQAAHRKRNAKGGEKAKRINNAAPQPRKNSANQAAANIRKESVPKAASGAKKPGLLERLRRRLGKKRHNTNKKL